jgi:hypothetical protein
MFGQKWYCHIKVIFLVLIMYGDLFQDEIAKCLVCLGINGASKFQGVKFGIIALMKIEQAPYIIWIHCMAHRTNLEVHNLFSM